MREIKFRAWFAKNKAMVTVDNLEFFGGLFGTPVHAGVSAKTDFEKGGWYTPLKAYTNRKTVVDGSKEQVPRVVLMQYTGLKDKNDKEIYEGDIVQFKSVRDLTERYEVEYTSYSEWAIGVHRLAMRFKACEVIGNIYENLELLGD